MSYRSAPLPGNRCFRAVRGWDERGAATVFSDPASFESAADPFDKEQAHPYDDGQHDALPLTRATPPPGASPAACHGPFRAASTRVRQFRNEEIHHEHRIF